MKILLTALIAVALGGLPSAAVSAAPISVSVNRQLASAPSCPAGETYVKGYKKADGTMVSGYCRHDASSAKECAKDETYVHGYTKANGTEVKGYCRKKAPSAS